MPGDAPPQIGSQLEPRPARAEDYRVRLDQFEGPLDLLLHLCRRHEVEVTDIPIAEIADQYMSFLKEIERVDIDVAGEFLLTAATLMEIKSRLLGSVRDTGDDGAEGEEEDAGDPRGELIRQLLEYKKYRDAADALQRRQNEWDLRHGAGRAGLNRSLVAALSKREEEIEIDDISLVDLVEAFARVCEVVNFERVGEHAVEMDDTPVELHAEDLIDQLARADADGLGLTLRQIITGRRRVEMVGLFLAMLELVRQRRVRISQDSTGGEIRVSLRQPEAETPVETSTGTAGGDA